MDFGFTREKGGFFGIIQKMSKQERNLEEIQTEGRRRVVAGYKVAVVMFRGKYKKDPTREEIYSLVVKLQEKPHAWNVFLGRINDEMSKEMARTVGDLAGKNEVTLNHFKLAREAMGERYKSMEGTPEDCSFLDPIFLDSGIMG